MSPAGQATIVFCLALSVRVGLCAVSAGEPVVDVASFQRWAEHIAAGRNPYTAAEWPANYPPLWLLGCWLAMRVSRLTWLGFDPCLKLLVGLFDASTAAAVSLVARALAWRSRPAAESDSKAISLAWVAGLLYIFNPVALLVGCFQGQNDPVVLALVLWALWLLIAQPVRQAEVVALLLLGLSVLVKPFALLWLPLLLGYLPDWRSRLLASAASLALPAAVTAACLLSSPSAVLGSIASYRGPPDFGWVGLYNAWSNLGHAGAGTPIIERLPWYHRLAFAPIYAAVWWRLRRRPIDEQLTGVVLALYIFYGTLGAQYLLWLIPFGCLRPGRQVLSTSLWTAVALLAFYQLHHPAILSGEPGRVLRLGLTIPQWGALLFLGQAMLYARWIRWLALLLTRPGTSSETARGGKLSRRAGIGLAKCGG